MVPANKQAKNIVVRKFILLYGISLLVITTVIYFLFNTPASLFKKSIQNYKNAEVEESQLLNKIDAITTDVNKIIENDKSYQLAMNVADKEKFKENIGEYTNDISAAIADLENDSARRKSSYSDRSANNYLFVVKNFLDYRDASSNDFATLETRKDLPGAFRIALDSLRSYQVQLNNYKNLLATETSKNASLSSQTNNASDANIKAANDRLIEDLQTKLRQAQGDLNNCNQQKATLIQTASQTSGTNITQQQMASLLSEFGKKIYNQALQGKNFKGGTIEQRAYFMCAKQIFEEAKTHQVNSDIDTYMANIAVQLKKLTN